MYSGIKLPLLLVSILYGTVMVLLPAIVFRFALIDDHLLFQNIKFILTISMSTCGTFAPCSSTSCTAWLPADLHTPLKCPISGTHCTSFHRLGTVLVHVFPHSISMVILGCLYSAMLGGLSLSLVQLLPCQSFPDLSLHSILWLVLSVLPCIWPISKCPCHWRGCCYFS